MAVTHTVVAGSFGRALREEMAAVCHHMLEDQSDPLMRNIAVNSSRVESTAKLGRTVAAAKTSTSTFEAQHPVSFGLAGTIEYATPHQTLKLDDAANTPVLNKTASYPSADVTPQRTYDWLTIPLKFFVGNVTIEKTQTDAIRYGSPVDDLMGDLLMDPMKILHKQLTIDFLGSGYGVIATVAANASSITAGATGTLTLNGPVGRFHRGMRLTLWANAGSDVPDSTQRGSGVDLMVVGVSNFDATPTITVYNMHASTATGSITGNTTGTGDVLVLKGAWNGTTAYGATGLGHFSNNSASIHGLSKATYPELKSYNDVPGTNRNPIPSIFQEAYDAIYDRGYEAPNQIVITRGVRSLYYQYERQLAIYNTDLGNPVQRGADGGMSGTMQFTTEQGTIPFVISRFAPKNTAFMFNTNALIRYVPNGMDALDFLSSWEVLGGRGGFLPAMSGSEYTRVAENPFSFYYELGCKMPQCIGKIGNLLELKDVA